MNIKEARKVLWLKNHHKTLGELMDEGYLNQSRLEWAAEKAYDPALKEAAKVILNAKSLKPVSNPEEKAVNTVEIPIPLDKARSTSWPLAPFKGQLMGDLVDSKQLSLKDLGFAIENAWDEKVRQAAIALSLVRLEQVVKEPVPDVGFVHVVSGGRSYSEREEMRLTFIQGIELGLVIAFLFYLIWWTVQLLFGPHPTSGKSLSDVVSTPLGVFTLIIVLGFYIFATWLIISVPKWISDSLDKKIEEHRFGKEGEEQVLQLIIQSLDGHWSVFQNVSLPGRNKGDLDLILVGPPGVWVLEVKNFRGEYRNIGENWEYRHDKKWKSTSKSPSQQAFNSALRLSNFLKADNVKVFVNAAVVWANEESPLTVENPSVAVWSSNRLADELGNIWQTEKLPVNERNKIVDKLSKLCEHQKKSSP
jgi:hypothetical protein